MNKTKIYFSDEGVEDVDEFTKAITNKKMQTIYSISHARDDLQTAAVVKNLKAYGKRRGIPFSFLVMTAIKQQMKSINEMEIEGESLIKIGEENDE